MPCFFEIGLPVPKKKDFERILFIYGHGGHLIHVTLIIYICIGFPFLKILHIKFGFDWLGGFREEIFENVNRQTSDGRTDGRTPARVPYYQLPMSLWLR